MAVILKKEEKIKEVLENLAEKYSFQDFLEKFIELFEKDWKKIEKTYNDHLRKTNPGKKNPMPKSEQYLKNALNIWNKNNNL